MLLKRLTSPTFRTGIRMVSTMGKSGRVYVQGEVLQRHREDHKFSVFRVESGDESFVSKRVPGPFYDLSVRLAAEFAGSWRLRLHVDCNPEEGILIYPYFKTTLLALMLEDPDFPPAERMKVLRRVGEGVQELHDKDWMHTDVKPDNILINWTCDKEGNKTVTDAVLGDFDIAFKLKDGEARHTPYAIGNAMWRSPEGQTGRCMTKASDIFSFGLVCIHALGGGELLLLNNYEELVKHDITPEQEILTRHFAYFGPVGDGLFKQVGDEDWCAALKEAAEIAEQDVKEQPERRFEWWGKDLGPEALDLIKGMMNLDPSARLTIDQVLTHRWWEEDT